MDSELRFISALLHANAAEQSDFWNKQLPNKVFTLRGQEMLWLSRFRERNGKYPSVEAFEAKYPEEGLPLVTDPLGACLEPILTTAAFTEIKQVVDKTTELFDKKEDPTKIVEAFRHLASKVTSHEVAYVDEDMRDPMTAFLRYRDMAVQVTQNKTYIQSPWPTLNKLISFVRPGELFTITARTSLGKTWILANWADFLARAGVPTFIMSKEMPTASIADRMTAIRYGLDWEKFRTASLDISDQVKWKIAMRNTSAMPYTLVVSGEETIEGTGIEHLYAKVQRMRPQVIMVDGAYLMKISTVGKNASPVEQATEVSRMFKRMAKVLKAQVFVVNQMNRQAEDKKGIAKGTLGNVYGSDAWAQDSDFLLEVSGERGSNERVLRLLKSRDTGIGDMFINFILSPKPNFEGKATMSGAAMSGIKFKVIH
jgi:hypothetical protein